MILWGFGVLLLRNKRELTKSLFLQSGDPVIALDSCLGLRARVRNCCGSADEMLYFVVFC